MNSSRIDVELDGVFLENGTIDYTDYEYKPDEELREGKAVWIPIVYCLITIVGLLGNGLILAVLAQKRKAWRTSDIFVVNLCAVDILLLLTLPVWAVQATRSCGWCVGAPPCRFIAAVFNINYFFGFLLLVCISLDLYLYVTHTKRLFFLDTPRNAQVGCAAAWLVALLLTIPDLGATEVTKAPEGDRTLCVPSFYLPEWQRPSRLIHHLLSLVAVLAVCFSGGLLWVRQGSKSLMKQKSVKIVQLLAGVFILCWIPYSIVLLVDTARGSEKDPEESGSSLNKSLAATAALGCLHACLRPLLYLSLCKKFRNQALATLQCKKAEFKGSMWELGIGESPLVSQNVDKEEIKQFTVENQST
ncbi:C-X-C chemokine receptor type 3-like [Neosynchiropus ocellatus]